MIYERRLEEEEKENGKSITKKESCYVFWMSLDS